MALKNRLERRYGQHHLHFITCSCYRRRPLLGAKSWDVCLKILDEGREPTRRTSKPAPFANPAKSAAPAKDRRSLQWFGRVGHPPVAVPGLRVAKTNC